MELSRYAGESGKALILKAAVVAADAHWEQKRSYTEEPYVNHVLRVARGVAQRTRDAEVIAAALLHDVLEDSRLTEHDLRRQFPDRTVDLVVALTDVYTHEAYPHLNRKARKGLEAVRMGGTSAEAQLIKAYDLLDNTANIAAHDPQFAKTYLAEKRELLVHLTKLPPEEWLQLEGRCVDPII